mmetsp:Transcript_42272/g.111656  ORF Transcript_42272/g.111656 Transcript_42272/m.111656 type:complete len:416 (-) Transcript_42272:304-1551(-)
MAGHRGSGGGGGGSGGSGGGSGAGRGVRFSSHAAAPPRRQPEQQTVAGHEQRSSKGHPASSPTLTPMSGAACGAAAQLRSRVLELALEPQGSREVQQVLEAAPAMEQEMLVRELKGHIAKALQSPHANHVLQKAISVMWPADTFFIVPELLQWGCPSTIAKHPYGCRVLERLMEFFPSTWLGPFFGDILGNAAELCRHPYANFVVQHMFEHGEDDHRRHLVKVLCADLASLATNQNACGVLDKALTYSAKDDQNRLVEQVLSHDGLLVQMAIKRWGFATAERLLSVARGSLLDDAHRQMVMGLAVLQRTASGRQLLEVVYRHKARQMSAVGGHGHLPPPQHPSCTDLWAADPPKGTVAIDIGATVGGYSTAVGTNGFKGSRGSPPKGSPKGCGEPFNPRRQPLRSLEGAPVFILD